MLRPYIKDLGAAGENSASAFLASRGFSIVERNFYAGRSGEIDIIAINGNLMIFAEVKARRSDKYGGGIYSISEKKKRRMRKSAEIFLLKNPALNSKGYTMRFDLIIIEGDDIKWVEDIIR